MWQRGADTVACVEAVWKSRPVLDGSTDKPLLNRRTGDPVLTGEWFLKDGTPIGKLNWDTHCDGCTVRIVYKRDRQVPSILKTEVEVEFHQPKHKEKVLNPGDMWAGYTVVDMPAKHVKKTVEGVGFGWVESAQGDEAFQRLCAEGVVPLQRVKLSLISLELNEKCGCGAHSPYKRREVKKKPFKKPAAPIKKKQKLPKLVRTQPRLFPVLDDLNKRSKKRAKVEVIDLTKN